MTVRGYKMRMSHVDRKGKKTRPSHWVDVPAATRDVKRERKREAENRAFFAKRQILPKSVLAGAETTPCLAVQLGR